MSDDGTPELVCTNCLREVPATANVCGYCGHRLKTDVQPSVDSRPDEMSAPQEQPSGSLAPGSTIAGIALIAASAMPWFRKLPSPWFITVYDGIPGLRLSSDVPRSLASFGLVVFIIGVLALAFGMSGRWNTLRRLLGLLAVAAVVFAVMTLWNGPYGSVLSSAEIGLWVTLLSGLVLLAGR